MKKVSLAAGASSFVAWDFTNIEECKSVRCTLPYSITVTGKNADLSDTIEGNMSIVQDPIILQNTLSSNTIEAGTQKDLSLTLPENINMEKSRYTLTLSNNPFVGIEDTYKTLLQYPYGCVEQLLSSTLPNAILKRFTKLSEDIEVKPTDLENNLSLGLAKILKLQNTDGGFKYWENDPVSDKAMTPHVLRTLLEMRDAGVVINDTILQNAANYLKNTINAEQPTYLRLEALWAYSRYYAGQKDKIAGAFGFPNIATAYKAESLTSHDLLSYTYALYYTDKELYKAQIEKNISLLKQLKNTDSDYEYYSPTEDIAHLAILEMKLGKTQAEVTPAIVVLYQKNWKSYWYSTKERNAAFLAFVAYMESYGTQYENTLEMLFASGTETKNLSSEDAVVQMQKVLSSVLTDQVTPLTLKNTSGNATIFATADIEVHPLDPLKVKPYSNGMQVRREIYEVIDDTKLEEECAWDEARGYYCLPAAGLKLFTGNTFKKGAMYQIRLKANFSDRDQRNNLTLEDHLPAGFTILNSRFQTNSIATSQSSSDTWAWNYVNLRPETVMANARYSWGNEDEYKYFIRADFVGEYLYPPLAGYLMYEPTVRANTEFRRIVVK